MPQFRAVQSGVDGDFSVTTAQGETVSLSIHFSIAEVAKALNISRRKILALALQRGLIKTEAAPASRVAYVSVKDWLRLGELIGRRIAFSMEVQGEWGPERRLRKVRPSARFNSIEKAARLFRLTPQEIFRLLCNPLYFSFTGDRPAEDDCARIRAFPLPRTVIDLLGGLLNCEVEWPKDTRVSERHALVTCRNTFTIEEMADVLKRSLSDVLRMLERNGWHYDERQSWGQLATLTTQLNMGLYRPLKAESFDASQSTREIATWRAAAFLEISEDEFLRMADVHNVRIWRPHEVSRLSSADVTCLAALPEVKREQEAAALIATARERYGEDFKHITIPARHNDP